MQHKSYERAIARHGFLLSLFLILSLVFAQSGCVAVPEKPSERASYKNTKKDAQVSDVV